ncbi:TniB family NTP-binding protein (plasmid) [Nitrobacter sp. NHB1]|uniref:TniB family NTP-binding protein n=1 Tax=Nitrobacter sp. NHB1 TaxID=3119830 RepID=UPI002FFF09ED
MGEHLTESLRPWLQKPAAERIAHLQAPRWIGTQAARDALDLLQAGLDRAPGLRTRGVMLIGPYANGKSMIAERFAIMDRRRADAERNPRRVVLVQTREGSGLVNFYAGILAALEAPQIKARDTSAKADQLDRLLRQLKPRVIVFDEFHNCLRGRSRDSEAIFAVLRRFGRDYDLSPALVGELAIFDHVMLTAEMASRFQLGPVPRWSYDDAYLSLLDSLEVALPLAQASGLSDAPTAKLIFELSDGLIGETVAIVTTAAIAAVRSGAERISRECLRDLGYIPLSRRRQALAREVLA